MCCTLLGSKAKYFGCAILLVGWANIPTRCSLQRGFRGSRPAFPSSPCNAPPYMFHNSQQTLMSGTMCYEVYITVLALQYFCRCYSRPQHAHLMVRRSCVVINPYLFPQLLPNWQYVLDLKVLAWEDEEQPLPLRVHELETKSAPPTRQTETDIHGTKVEPQASDKCLRTMILKAHGDTHPSPEEHPSRLHPLGFGTILNTPAIRLGFQTNTG